MGAEDECCVAAILADGVSCGVSVEAPCFIGGASACLFAADHVSDHLFDAYMMDGCGAVVRRVYGPRESACTEYSCHLGWRMAAPVTAHAW